jgi:hypothetical protein
MTAKACQDALETAFKADPQVISALGNPVRIHDAPIKMAAAPFAFWRRWETRAIDLITQEHVATLEVVSKQTGASEARAAIAALAARANGPVPSANGAKIVLIVPIYADVMRSADGRSWSGMVRLKIVSEGTG